MGLPFLASVWCFGFRMLWSQRERTLEAFSVVKDYGRYTKKVQNTVMSNNITEFCPDKLAVAKISFKFSSVHAKFEH